MVLVKANYALTNELNKQRKLNFENEKLKTQVTQKPIKPEEIQKAETIKAEVTAIQTRKPQNKPKERKNPKSKPNPQATASKPDQEAPKQAQGTQKPEEQAQPPRRQLPGMPIAQYF